MTTISVAPPALAPTPEQEAIIAAAKTSASLMINALAGTGKTTTLTMLAKALPVGPVLALAFNKKIKEELAKRFPLHFTVMTMNGLGHRAWADTIGKKQMLIDERKLGRLTSAALRRFPDSKDSWNDIRQLVVYAMQRGLAPSQFSHAKGLVADTPQTWAEIAAQHDLLLTPGERQLARSILCASIEEGMNGVISYDDQIYLPVVFEGQFQPFPIVMVDEAQDLSPLNHQMLRKCAAKRLIVVGDPRQAIYAFRGADSSSMASIKALRDDWIELSLNTTFRCPQIVVERQKAHAPSYTAAPVNLQGEIKDWEGKSWSWKDVQALSGGHSIAILCRNNAPLVSMAFALVRQGIGVNMLGRELGKGLASLAKKIATRETQHIDEFLPLLTAWQNRETQLALANEDESRAESVNDKAECITAVVEAKRSALLLEGFTVKALIGELTSMFAKTSGTIILASGHKSKGLEWDTVVHLDPWRVPSKWAKSSSAKQQENNLKYVIETRTKNRLILANFDDFS